MEPNLRRFLTILLVVAAIVALLGFAIMEGVWK